MRYSSTYKNLLLSNLELEAYSPTARKVVLLNILLYVSSGILAFFSIYNIFYTYAYYIGMIDTLAILGAIYAIYDIRKYGDIKRASLIATADIFILMSVLVYLVEGKDFTLIWTIFLPIFAIFINGSKKGLLITIMFYIIVFSIAYSGLDIWQDGTWNNASFARLIMASLGLTLITYFFEHSLEHAYSTLQEKQDLEENYIKTLEKCSITDPLTGLYNRRHLAVQFKEKLIKAKQNGSYFALVLLDIDKFKEYNDSYGHMLGDEALVKVAKALQESMRREADSTFRVGGEEFCAIFMADEHSKIVTSIENIKSKIMNLDIKHLNSPFGMITASFGVCIVNEFDNVNLDKMYKIADDYLYEAKENGRNCVIGSEKISAL